MTQAARIIAVFSAHAEVVPTTIKGVWRGTGILRARGGSSGVEPFVRSGHKYSPRTRR